MSKQRSRTSNFLIGSLLFICMLTILVLVATAYKDSNAATSFLPATNSEMATPTFVIHNKRYILKDASPQEVGEYVIERFTPVQLDPRGAVELVLARPITRDEMAALGLGCLPDFSTVEDPPLMLLILKGDFAFVALPTPAELMEGRYKYAAYAIDVWAAWPAFLTVSPNGAAFRKALNDPSLPNEGLDGPLNCPPRTPGTLPHGVEVPGIVFPTHPAEPTATYEPIPPAVPTAQP